MNKLCEFCSKDFSAERSTAKFCSDACKLKFNRKKYIDNELATKNLPPTIQASELPTPLPKTNPPPESELNLKYPRLSQGEPNMLYPDGSEKTPADRLFEEKNPNYYVYIPETSEKVCILCGESFKTRLQLLKFCSPNCRDDGMKILLVNEPHEKYKKWKGGK